MNGSGASRRRAARTKSWLSSERARPAHPERDWILSRVIWLGGTEDGVNRGGEVDSLSRYIYIHGTPQSEGIGVPRSHGCIRMRNDDVIALFDLLETGMVVQIDE